MLQKLKFIIATFLLFSSASFGQKKEFDDNYKLLLELAWSNLDSSKLLLKSLKLQGEKIKESEYNAYYFNAEGVILYVEEKYPEAHKKYQKAYLEAKKWGNHRFMGIMLNNIGACFADRQNVKKKIEYLNDAKEEFTLIKDEEWLVNVEYNLATAYYFDSQFDKALKAYQVVEKYYVKNKNFLSASYAIGGQGSVYLEQEKYDLALKHFKRSLVNFDKEADPESYANFLNKLGQVQLKFNLKKDAKSNMDEALKISKEIESVLEQTRSYELLREYFKAEKNIDSALFYSELASTFGDSLKWSNYNEKFAEEETKFNTQLKTEKIALQKENIAQQKASIQKLTILSVVLGILLLAIIFLWFRLNIRKHQLEIANKEKENLVKEIHHRVKNNLQVISSLLNMHVRKVKDPKSKKIFDDGISRIQAMSLIHQNIYAHSNLQQIKPREYVEKLVQQLFVTYQIPDKAIEIQTSIDDINLDIEKLMSIGLILNEILSNAFKYAFNGSKTGAIDILLHQPKTNEIEMTVKDNGSGISIDIIDEPGDSLGMRLIQAFSEKLKATLSIGNVNGTTYKFIFDPSK